MTYNNDSGMGSGQDQNKKNDQQGSQTTNMADAGSDNNNRTDRSRDNSSSTDAK